MFHFYVHTPHHTDAPLGGHYSHTLPCAGTNFGLGVTDGRVAVAAA